MITFSISIWLAVFFGVVACIILALAGLAIFTILSIQDGTWWK